MTGKVSFLRMKAHPLIGSTNCETEPVAPAGTDPHDVASILSTFLRLSECPSLRLFRHVLLLSSAQDRYVPGTSSLVLSSLPRASLGPSTTPPSVDDSWSALQARMASNLLAGTAVALCVPFLDTETRMPAAGTEADKSAQLSAAARGEGGAADTKVDESKAHFEAANPATSKNLLGVTQVLRIEVHFDFGRRPLSFSKFIGRMAHVELINSDSYLKLLIWGVLAKLRLLG